MTHLRELWHTACPVVDERPRLRLPAGGVVMAAVIAVVPTLRSGISAVTLEQADLSGESRGRCFAERPRRQTDRRPMIEGGVDHGAEAPHSRASGVHRPWHSGVSVVCGFLPAQE